MKKLLNKEILKKSIHRHVLSKMFSNKDKVKEIIADIKDPDNEAEVPKKDLSVSGQPTMYKNKLKDIVRKKKKQSL